MKGSRTRLEQQFHRKSFSTSTTAFPATKKDKRHIKHSNLITRVTKSSTSSSAAQRNKRRRQKRQLVADLESLADALPIGEDATTAGREGGSSRDIAMREQANVHLILRKSIKSRPGTLKRREKLDKGERERFARNLAEMNGKKIESADESSASIANGQHAHNRWAALRGFIAQTMEQRSEMKELKS
jgi:Ribosome biogenesis protein SLX9